MVINSVSNRVPKVDEVFNPLKSLSRRAVAPEAYSLGQSGERRELTVVVKLNYRISDGK